jgi:hypothetical protein
VIVEPEQAIRSKLLDCLLHAAANRPWVHVEAGADAGRDIANRVGFVELRPDRGSQPIQEMKPTGLEVKQRQLMANRRFNNEFVGTRYSHGSEPHADSSVSGGTIGVPAFSSLLSEFNSTRCWLLQSSPSS